MQWWWIGMWLCRSAIGAEIVLTVNQDGSAPSSTPATRPQQTVTLDVEEAPLQEVVDDIMRKAEVKIVIRDGLDGRVTASMEAVRWDIALHVILTSLGIQLIRQQDVYNITASP